MHRSSSSVTILLVMSTFFVVSCELSSKPLNQYAMLNDVKAKPMVLECHSTLRYRLTWLTKKPGSSSRCEIFNGYNLVEDDQQVSSYCNVENGTPGKYILNVNATKESAQQYICLEPGSLIEASAEITIFESDPECNVTSYNESTIFTCHVHFRGNWSPVMEWRNGTSGEVINEGVSSVSVPNESLTSRLIVPSNENLDSETYYSFITYFRIQDKPLETTANNIPSYFYMYNWTSQEHVTAHEHVEERTRCAVIAICLGLLVPIILYMIVITVCWKQNIYNKRPKGQKDRSPGLEEEKHLQLEAL